MSATLAAVWGSLALSLASLGYAAWVAYQMTRTTARLTLRGTTHR